MNLAALDELHAGRRAQNLPGCPDGRPDRGHEHAGRRDRKIDDETRELLSGTFQTVNEHFGRMFPELFGGGQAKLIITGDEILDSACR